MTRATASNMRQFMGGALPAGGCRAALLAAVAAAGLLAACADNDPVASTHDPVPERSYQIERTYVVRPGDFLASIAADHGLSLEDLLALNDLEDPTQIEAGQEIVLGLDEVSITPAKPRVVDSPASARSGLLNELPGWPADLSRGQSAFAFVAVAAAAAAALLYALYAALTLTLEALGPRLPRPAVGAPARPGLPRIWLPLPHLRRPRMPSATRTTERGTASLPTASGRAARGAASLARAVARASRRTTANAADRGSRIARWTGPRLRSAARSLMHHAVGASKAGARQLRPLGSKAAGASREAARRRQRAKLRVRLEESAEVPLRIGLVDEAELGFLANLELCEREGWSFETALCLRGLAQIAEARSDRRTAIEMLERAAELFEQEGVGDYALRARMRLQLLKEREPAVPGA